VDAGGGGASRKRGMTEEGRAKALGGRGKTAAKRGVELGGRETDHDPWGKKEGNAWD